MVNIERPQFTDDSLAFCRQYETMPRRELTDLYNAHFGTQLNVKQIKAYCTRQGLKTGRTGCFPKGHVPPNKGRKGYCAPGSEVSHFQPGHRPQTWTPVGTYRMTTPRDKFNRKRGTTYACPPYWRLKVAEGRWEFLHRLIWEDHNGPIPKGQSIIFVDGDTLHCHIDNLDSVDRGELAILNRHHGFGDAPTELRRTIIAMAKLHRAAGKRLTGIVTGPKGERKPLAELADDYGVKLPTVLARIRNNNWSVVEALTTPVGLRKGRPSNSNRSAVA